MLNFILYRLYVRLSINAFVVSIFCLHPVWADDTEIYFSQVNGKEAQPNILFLLDASLSMERYDCGDGSSSKDPCKDGSAYGHLSRLNRMNSAMSQILNSVRNVNIGLMRYSNTNVGARVIYPVSDVEQLLCDGEPCDENTDFIGSKTTVKQELIDVATNMAMQWFTPTVGGLLEATNYFTGGPVVYGKGRWLGDQSGGAKKVHPSERGRFSRVSHPDSYTGGTVYRNHNCTDADLSAVSCSSERIDGSPVYKSPIKNECQSNHLILISDGASSKDKTAFNRAKNLVGSCPMYVGESGQCGVEIADYLYNKGVTTHTIGFNLDSQWLEDVAISDLDIPGSDGTQTRYYEAASSDELVDAVIEILSTIDTTDSTFVAPGATVDQFSRLSHRSEVYLSLFKPSDAPGWQGNLKRYSLTGAELLDATGAAAVNPQTGAFSETSQSFWTGFVDGSSVAIGGAASRLNHSTRNAVTYTGTVETGLLEDANALSVDNDLLNVFPESESVNVALQGTAQQSTTAFGGSAGKAKDSNTNGSYGKNSVTHTDGDDAGLPWWELTLARQVKVERLVLHNRTDNCCFARLNNVHVFVSNSPFGDATLDELIARPGIWHRYLAGEQGKNPIELPANTTGQYVRVQLAQPGTLSLAEVEVFGIDAIEQENKEKFVDWIRGKDVKDADGDQDTTDNRLHMGDPLHSISVTVNYGGDAENPDSVVFVGTNEGYLHAISSRTGEEEFAFMPEALLSNIETLYEGDPSSGKVYGMDGDLTLWVEDENGNGAIEANTGDHAYLYAGMRRGGNQYYALDVTDRTNPKYMFSIPSSDPAAFAELGQSWSKPVLSKIRLGQNDERDVLIFAGGYDESQDNKTTRVPDSKGRALYIVDALDGKVLWSGQPTAASGGSARAFPAMQYSIPSDITVVEKSGLASQIYVGDMGGQLWRFDVLNDGQTGADLVDGGVIAVLSEANNPAATRRFFHAPDLVLSKSDDETVLNIGIGSGYRAHPLNTEIEDNFYLIRYPFKATGNYGLALDESETIFEPIVMDDLYDTTENLIGEGDVDVIAAEREALDDAQGWFINMERSGEKILGSSTTLENVVRFVSYVPGTQNLGACEPDIGESFFWTVNIADGTPYDSSDDPDESGLVKEDRWKDIPGGGLAPPVKTLFVDTTDGVIPTTVSGINVLEELDTVDVTKRWYWAESPE